MTRPSSLVAAAAWVAEAGPFPPPSSSLQFLLDQLSIALPHRRHPSWQESHIGLLAFIKVYDLNLLRLTPPLQASEGNKNVEVVYSFPSRHGWRPSLSASACVRACVNTGMAWLCTHVCAHAQRRGGVCGKTGCTSVPGKFPGHQTSRSASVSWEELPPALDSHPCSLTQG